MILARVVSGPTPVALNCRKPPVETVPAKTLSPVLFSGRDRLACDGGLIQPACAGNDLSVDGNLGPVLDQHRLTHDDACSGDLSCWPSRTTTATSRATATSSASADRVLFNVAVSRAWPTPNRNVTAAASQY